MGDGLGGWLQNMMDSASNATNALDRYINPFHTEVNWDHGEKTIDERRSTALSRAVAAPAADGLTTAMRGMSWAADNLVSQPLSTFLLMSGNPDAPLGSVLSASQWARAWHAAEHISPGQAFMMSGPDPGALYGTKDQHQVEQALHAPLVYAKPPPSALPAGFSELPEEEQQRQLQQAGMPAVGNAYVEKLRNDSAFFKYSSGTEDFAVRWWLDPTIVGGKVAGLARAEKLVKARPMRTIEGKAGRPWVRTAGWSQGDIQQIMNNSTMARTQKFLWENRGNPALINNLTMFRKSALGPRAGGIVASLKSPEEVGLFLRTSLGDVEARTRLQSENASAGVRLEQDTSRLSNLELEIMPRVQALNNPNLEALVARRTDQLRQSIAADEDLTARYGAALDHYGELDAVNLTRFSTDRATARTTNQKLFRTGPALGTAGSARSALSKTRIYANDFFGSSATVVRSFKEAHPNGLIAIDDIHPEAVDELRGQLARIPGIGPDIRSDYLNRYLKTSTEGQRMDLLEEIQGRGVAQVAKKHGFTYDEGMALYREYRANITHGQEELRRYSGANFGDERQTADIFMGHGERLRIHPNMVTKLANDQILIDLSALDKTLARNASSLSALRTSRAGNPDWMIDGLDGLSHLWKFATLFRLGYIPRVLGDDLLGQVARVGAAAMAVRTGYGVKNLATNLFHWKPASHFEGAEATAREGVTYAEKEMGTLQPQADALKETIDQRGAVHRKDLGIARGRLTKAQNKLAAIDPAETVKVTAMGQLTAKLDAQVKAAERRLAGHSPGRKAKLSQLQDQLDELASQRDLGTTAAEAAKAARLRGFRQSSQMHDSVEVGPGVTLPPALGGERGEYFQKLISSDDSLRTLLQGNKQMIHSNLQKSVNLKAAAPISYTDSEKTFVESWHKAINHQIMQDELARKAVGGASVDDMATWLDRTPQGRAYLKRLGIKYDTPGRIAASVWHEVDEYMPAGSGIREAAVDGKADIDFLTQAAKAGQHPQYVHSSQLGEALAGSNAATRSMDRVIDWWYKWAASLPADRMSRHPLFNQLYEGHAKALVSQEFKQGVKISQTDADRLAETARRLALRDTRKLVFDIAHRTDTAAMLRFMSPFYAATTEAWQRWARIIVDRPQTVGYASVFFNAPMAWGWMQDQDGNKVNRNGTAMVWDEKAKKLVPRLVPKSERRIMARVPKFIADGPIGKALGMDPSGNWAVSQDSMNLITQGDPWFNPGTGPIVSIPASLLVQDKPKRAEMLRHLGVLPFGPTPGGIGRTLYEQSAPGYLKNFLSAFDTSDDRYQRIKLQIMQQAAYEHGNLGKPMPSAQDIADRTKSYWIWSAVSAFTQPFATQKPDKYQFFRDQYNNLRRRNPLTADEEYLKRFGESHFIFAQATSENTGGVPATQKAVALTQKYANLIAKNPELAALIVGPEGNGPFSPEAYTYQLSSPLVPGGAEMQRTRLSADAAMKENQRRLGWVKYTQQMNRITAELHTRGLASFAEPGAEDLKDQKQQYTALYSEPLYPDGTPNPYYNAEWSKDFFTFDVRKYDRMIPGLTALARSPLAQQPNRSDLRKLQEYLGGRQALLQELRARQEGGGSKTLGAKANTDLAQRWTYFVDSLVEQDTRFGDLVHRYLSRDLGVDALNLANASEGQAI